MLLVLAFSLAAATFWVDTLKWGVIKPFNCVKCMTGWLTIPFTFYFNDGQHWLIMPLLGVFIGSIYSNFKMRYL
jgi:hypothetical protein